MYFINEYITYLLHEAHISELLVKNIMFSGTLVITIIDVNDFAPEFPSPWTVGSPYYELELLEEQPEGTLLGTFTATDRDSNIARYEIDPPNDYFVVNNSTGKLKFKLYSVVAIILQHNCIDFIPTSLDIFTFTSLYCSFELKSSKLLRGIFCYIQSCH